MFSASDNRMLAESYTDLAFDIGYDILTARYPRFQEAHTVWMSLSQEGQLQALKQWLASEANAESIIIFDDLDGLGDAKAFPRLLPQVRGRLIYSSRDPTLPTSPVLTALSLRIPQLSEEDSFSLLKREMETHNIEASVTEISSVAKISSYHPLTMLVSVHFMRHVLQYEQVSPNRSLSAEFIDVIRRRESKFRRDLLETELHGCLSLMQSFERSLQRLGASLAHTALCFIELVAFISSPYGIQEQSKYTEFFIARPWLDAAKAMVPDHTLLRSSEGKGRILAAIARVSLLIDCSSSDGQFLPIWLECARHRCEEQRMIDCLRQLCYVCFLDSTQGNIEKTANRFLHNIFINSTSFGISLAGLFTNSEIVDWISKKAEDILGHSDTILPSR